MCWSLEVSIIFSVIELVGIIFLWYRNYSKRDRCFAIFFLLIFLIEFSEIFLWITIPESGDFGGKCPRMNVFFTSMTYFVTRMQPLGINLYFLFSSIKRKQKSKFQLSTSIAALDLFFFIYSYSYKWYKVGSQKNCSSLSGEYDNLNWNWQYQNDRLLPSSYNYFTMSAIPLMFYRPLRALLNVMLPYFVTLIVSYLVFDTNVFPSTWCWTGLMILVFFILDPWIVERANFRDCFLKKKKKISFKDDDSDISNSNLSSNSNLGATYSSVLQSSDGFSLSD
ncbi:hypothetical protein M0813_00539 [Anaeramoeba flamelloides]|uniref:Uncharacterized protein n=1 Tax=Anaeramoeba flamelloides TaxID=1746091 RepID=A0ABQ8YB80_9EUKA|nr:hypothetical protein M0813_00539 [Anaeramoeba flamelloides]